MMVRKLLSVSLLALATHSISLKPMVRVTPLFHGSSRLPSRVLHLRGGGKMVLDKSHAILSRISPTSAFTSFGAFYSRSLEFSPIVTKSITAMVLFAISDQLAQGLELQRNRKLGIEKKPFLTFTNKKRSLFSGLVGLFYFGPMAHLWYGWIFTTFPGKSMVSILQKAALGQFFFAPPLFCVFFAAALVQSGQFTLGNWVHKIRQDLLKGWVGGLGFWPIVNAISYGYVPQKWIPLFINLMGLVFNIYVSLVANRKKQPGAAKVE